MGVNRTGSYRWLIWHQRNLWCFLSLDNIVLMRIATTFLVRDRWGLPFRFIEAWTLDKLYILLLMIFKFLYFLCCLLFPFIFLDVRGSYWALGIATIFSIIIFLYFSINHFLQVIDEGIFVLFRSL